MSKVEGGGAASAASPRRKRKRKAGQSTVSGTVRAASHNAAVLNWVREQTRAGIPSKEIVALSKTDDSGYPLPGQPLSDGSLVAVHAAIYHLEAQGARFPLDDSASALKRTKSATTGRLHDLGKQRAAARKAGDPLLFWDVCYEITKCASFLEAVEVEHVDLTETTLDLIDELHTDLLRLQIFQDRVRWAIEKRLGEHKLWAKIKAARAKTVENGATAEEAKNAQRMADLMEQRLTRELSA